MRAREFLREFTLNIPITINLPLKDILQAAENQQQVINPGVRYGDDGDAKWSPPLQQHLDTVKDSVGPSQEGSIRISDKDVFHEPHFDDDSIEVIDSLNSQTAILDTTPSMPE